MADEKAVSSTTSNNMNLCDAFDTFETCKTFFQQMIPALKGIDASVTVLVLNGLCGIGEDVERDEFVTIVRSEFLRDILRDWRCNSSLSTFYSQTMVPDLLQNLSVFRKWKIPMFVGQEGRKQSLAEFEGDVEDIVIGKLKVKILDPYRSALTMDNILDGSWYKVVDDSGGSDNDDDEEVKAIPVEELCDKGLRQGEIINFEDTMHVILYATDYTHDQSSARFSGLKKPTVAGLKKNGSRSQICLWIFVPEFGKPMTPDELQRLSITYDDEGEEIRTPRKSVRPKVDLIQAFVYKEYWRAFVNQLANELSKIEDPTIHMLAIEAFFRLRHFAQSKSYLHYNDYDGSFPMTSEKCPQIRSLTQFLSIWRQQSHLPLPNNDVAKCLLKNLDVFKTLHVPMVIDSCGQVELMRSFLEEDLETIKINGETRVVHVEHRAQAKTAAKVNEFEENDGENTVTGTWFEIVGDSEQHSVYGSKGFRTTLSQLGVTGLEQGEIVCNKYERNVILYATDDEEVDFEGLKKPRKEYYNNHHHAAPKDTAEVNDDSSDEGRNAPYVHVSIFVPWRLVPNRDDFWDVFNELVNVDHGPFCLVEKREGEECPDKKALA